MQLYTGWAQPTIQSSRRRRQQHQQYKNYIFARQLIAFSIPTRSIDDYNDDIGLLDQTTFSLFRNNSEIYCVLLLFICIT